jgi:hypothetical protein
MKKHKIEGDLKSIIFLGSMGLSSILFAWPITHTKLLSSASWQAIPDWPMYSASKHGVLGFMRSLFSPCLHEGIRVGVIHPWFADTSIIPTYIKVALAGIPLTPVERVAGAIVYAATDPDMDTSGCPWLLPNDGYVFRLEREQLKEGVYKMIDDRIKVALTLVLHAINIFHTLTGYGDSRGIQGVKYAVATVRDLWKILGKPTMLGMLLYAAARYLYSKRADA